MFASAGFILSSILVDLALYVESLGMIFEVKRNFSKKDTPSKYKCAYLVCQIGTKVPLIGLFLKR